MRATEMKKLIFVFFGTSIRVCVHTRSIDTELRSNANWSVWVPVRNRIDSRMKTYSKNSTVSTPFEMKKNSHPIKTINECDWSTVCAAQTQQTYSLFLRMKNHTAPLVTLSRIEKSGEQLRHCLNAQKSLMNFSDQAQRTSSPIKLWIDIERTNEKKCKYITIMNIIVKKCAMYIWPFKVTGENMLYFVCLFDWLDDSLNHIRRCCSLLFFNSFEHLQQWMPQLNGNRIKWSWSWVRA